MSAKIIPKKSTVQDKVPQLTDLLPGEIAINYTDMKLYGRSPNDVIVNLTGALEVHRHVITDVDQLPEELDARALKGDNTDLTSITGLTGPIEGVTNIIFDQNAGITPNVPGQVTWNDQDGTLDIALNHDAVSVLQVGMETVYRVINNSGATIPNGTAVMYTGSVGNSGRLRVAPWDGIQESEAFMGLASQDIPHGDEGYVTHFGKARGVPANGADYGESWADGDILYAGANGGLTNVPQIAPARQITVGVVISNHQSNGTIFVRPDFGSSLANDELVYLSNLTDGDLIQYVAANGRYENKSLADAGVQPTLVSGANIKTINGNNLLGSGNIIIESNLSTTRDANQYTILNSNGDGITLLGVTQTDAGVMSAADKTKLDGIEAGSQVNTVDTVNGYTGTVVLTTDDVDEGISNQYFTVQRARDSISAGGDLSYDPVTGVVSFDETYSTPVEVKTAYESNIDTNAFTDADESKLDGIETGAQVNTVDTVNGYTGAVVLNQSDVGLSNVDNTADLDKPVSTAQQTALDLKIDLTEKGAADGVATLDANAKIPLTQLSDAVLGQVSYQGTWDASTNTPTLPLTPTVKGDYYVVSAPGTFAGITFATGDWIISKGDVWEKVDNTDAVSSVAGRTGNVVLSKVDVGLSNVQNVDTTDASNLSSGTLPGARFTDTSHGIRGGGNLHANVTQATDGFMSSGDKAKLDGIEAGSQANVATNLSNSASTDDVTVESSTGTNTSILGASQTNAGVMTSTDKTKLDGIEIGAQVNVDTNLALIGTGNTRTITSSTGNNVTIPTGTQTNAGLISTGDKTKLDGIEAGAQVNTVDTVNGATGTVVLNTDNIGEGATNLYYTDARASAAAPVQTVNGQTGAVSLDFDNYGGWTLLTNGTSRGTITSAESVDFKAGTNVSLAYSATNNAITISSTDTNSFLSDLAWNAGTGVLTATVDGAPTQTVDLDGRYLLEGANAVSASKLLTARTIALSGDLSGSAAFDGSTNITITATVADDSHDHVIGNVDGLQTALDSKFDKTGGTISGDVTVSGGTGPVVFTVAADSDNTTETDTAKIVLSQDGGIVNGEWGFDDANAMYFQHNYTGNIDLRTSSGEVRANGSRVLTVADEGVGNGLDADTLDGQHGAYYRNASNLNAGTISDARLPATITSDLVGNADSASTLDFRSITPNTSNDSSGYYAKIARLTIDNRYKDYNAEWRLVDYSNGNQAYQGTTVEVRVKQQADFGGDPTVDVTKYFNDTSVSDIHYYIVQNTPTTIVDFYIKVDNTYTVSALYEIFSIGVTNKIEWYESPSFVSSIPVGSVINNIFKNYHGGNFDPDTKFDKSGGTITNPVTIEHETSDAGGLILNKTDDSGSWSDLVIKSDFDRDVAINFQTAGGGFFIGQDSAGDDSLLISPATSSTGTDAIAIEVFQNRDVEIPMGLTVGTIDGNGAGLTNVNAETLDSFNSSDFMRNAASNTILDSTDDIDTISQQGFYGWNGSAPANVPFGTYGIMIVENDGAQPIQLVYGSTTNHRIAIRRKNSGIWSDWTEFLTTTGKAADADLLDGQSSAFYRNASNLNAGTISDARLPASISSDITGTAANANLLDNLNSTQFVRSDVDDTINGNLTLNNGTSTSLSVLASDLGVAEIGAYGSASQSTGVLYAGQSPSHGGGIFYNGDANPAYANGEASDKISIFRRTSDVNHVVMDFSHDSNDVSFKGVINGDGSGLTGVNATTLDSINSTQFLRSDSNDTYTGSVLTINNSLDMVGQIRHSGDSDTYMQFNAENTWRVVTGGSQRLAVNNTGADLNGDLDVSGDIKLTGTDSYIWSPTTVSGFTGLWDGDNGDVAWSYKNDEGVTKFRKPTAHTTQAGTEGCRVEYNETSKSLEYNFF